MNPFHKEKELEAISEINVVPLADVSLVLLIILLVLSPMMAQHRLLVQAAAEKADSGKPVPEPPSTAPKPPVDMVLVVGLAADRMTVGERTFTGTGEITAYLAGALLLRSDRKVFLAPQPEVAHGRVVETIELLKAAGASSVALVQSAPGPEGPGESFRAPEEPAPAP